MYTIAQDMQSCIDGFLIRLIGWRVDSLSKGEFDAKRREEIRDEVQSTLAEVLAISDELKASRPQLSADLRQWQ
jgi:hypothetical protein